LVRACGRLSTARVLQEARAPEPAEGLGWDRYERRKVAGGSQPGYRSSEKKLEI
jgi:hypothetical protein